MHCDELISWIVYHVLLHLHKRLPLGAFFRLIEDGGDQLAPASSLLQVYAREQNREMLRDFYYSDDRRVESAVLALEEIDKMTVRRIRWVVVCCHSRYGIGSRSDHYFCQGWGEVLFRGQGSGFRGQGFFFHLFQSRTVDDMKHR